MNTLGYISLTVTKKKTQAMVKALIQSGFTVEKLDSGYECKSEGDMLFKAMISSNSYSVRMLPYLFQLTLIAKDGQH